jgi:hypothetical protein
MDVQIGIVEQSISQAQLKAKTVGDSGQRGTSAGGPPIATLVI